MSPRAVIVGGGVGGSAAALHLARQGIEVVVVEAGDRLGGLVASFEVAGTPLERFYHHVFPGERDILDLVTDLGCGPALSWHPSSVGILTGHRVWPFTSPHDLLRFQPLPLHDRVHAGVGALRLARVRDWEQLDGVPALEWLTRYTGASAVRVVWDPLLRAKFGRAASDVPAAWMWGRFRQRAQARSRGAERLGYLRGGFLQLFDALALALEGAGAEIRTSTRVEHIDVRDGEVAGVGLSDGALEVDAVLFTGPLPLLPGLVPASVADPRWSAIGALGVMCVVLELARPLGRMYWTNVCDPAVPFGGIIEHTNLVPPADYDGRHIVYLSRYFTHDEPLATADLEAEAKDWINVLAERFPGFAPSEVTACHPFRTLHAAPLVSVGHRLRLPPVRSRVPGLYLATTAQIYPQDRGMSEGVRLGQEAARLMGHDLVWPSRKCG